MTKALLTLIVLGLVGGSVYAYYRYGKTPPAPTVTTARVTRGDIADTVGATGTLQAVTTVQVGTQVSGTIQNLYADFNSIVQRGQVLARLDPSLFQTQIEQARANLIRAQADVERLRVGLDDARTKLARATELWDRQLIPRSELDNADVTVRSTDAQIRSAQAQVTQAEASLNQNLVNLAHTVIEAPIDGLVISRNVDVGQTVAASMQAPTLFVLAADLTKMQVLANLDESDVGRIRPGQGVSFRVDAYPAEDFRGTVAQVRLQPVVQQNVVTYATVIDVPNPELKLKPGMTATVSIEIAHRRGVLRVPNAALRFRPTNEIFAALGQTPPDTEGDRAQRAPRAAKEAAADTGTGPAAAPDPQRGRPMGERGRALPPGERARMLERLRARGFDPSPGEGRGPNETAPPRDRAQASGRSAATAHPRATTIDALFGPLPAADSVGRVWLHVDAHLEPAGVRLGITDGQATELIAGALMEGAEVVTNVVTGTETTRPAPVGFVPFLGGRPPGSGRGGGGRGF